MHLVPTGPGGLAGDEGRRRRTPLRYPSRSWDKFPANEQRRRIGRDSARNDLIFFMEDDIKVTDAGGCSGDALASV